MTKAETAVINAAVAMWRGMRPRSWGFGAHLQAPTVNAKTPREVRLAEAVANLLLKRR